ncbi:MAG: DUF2339 domain-containing protein [Oscillospiraceae bacterium]|nr:DUF2339 domain-containing protein [Oscillospiraceae bacterium]
MVGFFILVIAVLLIVLFVQQSKLRSELLQQRNMINWLLEAINAIRAHEAAKAERPEDAPAPAPPPVEIPPEPEAAPPINAPEHLVPEYPAPAPQVSQSQGAQPQASQLRITQPHISQPLVSEPQTVHPQIPEPQVPEPQIAAPQILEPQVTHQQVVTPPAPKPKRKGVFSNENWVGISLFNRLGALLVIIGTIAVAALETFHPLLRTSILFAFALAVMGLGEVMNRKKPTIVSMGVSATGVALTYVAIAASFFALGTLGMSAALVACIIATALGAFLAMRYKAQVIGCFALIGGYLPIFALDPLNNPMMVGVMVYFTVLSLFSLTLALTRKWSIMNIIGFALTVIGTSYLGWRADPGITLVYACFAFLLYTALPLIAAYRTKEQFGPLDVWLIIANTLISSVVIFLIANRLDIQSLHAYLSLVFALVYAGLAFWAKGGFTHRHMPTIFTLTSIAFFVLFVPFFFAARWFAIFWLVQATSLAAYGIVRRSKAAEYSGLGILGLSAIAFLTNNFIAQTLRTGGLLSSLEIVPNGFLPDWQFTFDYGFFTLGMLAILACYFLKGRQRRGYGQVHKIAAFANLWIFALYILLRYVLNRLDHTVFEYPLSTVTVLLTFALAYLYCKVKFWADTGTRILTNVMHFAGIMGLWTSSIVFGILQGPGDNIRLIVNLLTAIIGFALVIHYHRSEKQTTWTVAYKNINIVSLWLLFLWCLGSLLNDFFGVQMLLTTLTFAVAFVIIKLPAIADRGTRVIALVMYGTGLLWLWTSSLLFGIFQDQGYNLRLMANLLAAVIGFALVLYFHRSERQNPWAVVCKNIHIVGLWLMLLWCVGNLLGDFWGTQMLLTTLTFAAAFAIIKLSAIADRGTRVIALVMYGVGLLWLWASSLLFGIFQDQGYNLRLMANLLAAVIGFALVLYYHRAEKQNPWAVVCKNINIVGLWLMLLWCIGNLLGDFWGMQMLLIALTFFAAFGVTRIPLIADGATHIIAIVMYGAGLVWLWLFNFWPYSPLGALMALNAVLQLLALFALYDLMSLYSAKRKLTALKIVILSAYFLLVVTQTMMVQADVAFNSALISILYALAAFAWIIVGFRLKHKPTRLAGLFLSMAAVAKLLIVDTWGLSTGMRIISYISLGLLLMLISFIYQRLSKRLESEGMDK